MELSCNSRELQVTGPIQITLPLPDNSGLRVSDPVPAWAFDSKTGKKKEEKKKRRKDLYFNRMILEVVVKMQTGQP